jgi:lipid II:glycine glycyltransferase (peptidoglycan interpeptide bridge formation enzyme)
MQINFLEERNKKEWNQFLFQNEGSFLQSFEWGEFQKSLAKKVWRIIVKENGKILAEAQIVRETFPLKFKNNFYIPFGPCLSKILSSEQEKKVISAIFIEVQRLAKTENVVFLKIEEFSKFLIPKIFPSKISQKRIQPQRTLILGLDRTEQEIFKNFSQKVRYNIRLAEKKGVKIKFDKGYDSIFYSLIKKTSQRDDFQSFGEEHYKKLFVCDSNDFKVQLCSAIYENKIIACYILIIFGETATCLHGASDWDYRMLKAPNLAQWARIKMAKEMGAKRIDFWGIDKKKWPGITAFKKGFGGEELEYPLSKDVIFQKFWYQIYYILRKFK